MSVKKQRDLDRHLGETITAERRRMRLSQQQLAARARLSIKTISNIEQGTVSPHPGEGTKAGIEEVLGWSSGDFDRVRAGGRPTHRSRVVTEADANEVFVYQVLKVAPPEAFREIRHILERYVTD